MPELRELNGDTTLAQQLQVTEDGPVVLINVFTVDASEEDALLEAWKHDADFMREQPGYISTQMHKGIGG
ncbi:MAG: antibiotic biosynthesis monooxygenase, partial [Planctomycetota bacterium]